MWMSYEFFRALTSMIMLLFSIIASSNLTSSFTWSVNHRIELITNLRKSSSLITLITIYVMRQPVTIFSNCPIHRYVANAPYCEYARGEHDVDVLQYIWKEKYPLAKTIIQSISNQKRAFDNEKDNPTK